MPPDKVDREAQGRQGGGLRQRRCRPTPEQMAGSSVFVTVGSTKFDALIKAMDSLDVADELASRKYTSLIMQVTSHLRNSTLRD